MTGCCFKIKFFACGNGENASRCVDGEEACSVTTRYGVSNGIAIRVIIIACIAIINVN